MMPLNDDIFDTDFREPDFLEHGHERGAGASLFPDRVRLDVSLPLELEAWLNTKAFERGLARAQFIRQVLRREQRKDRRFSAMPKG
jgi:hypothetical protein